MRIRLMALTAPVLALCLAGCPSPSFISGPVPTSPMPYPNRYPVATASPDPWYNPSPAPSAPNDMLDGLSIDDAYHQVQRYVSLHYPGAELVSAQSSQVGATGRISRAGAWVFTYLMMVPTSSETTTPASPTTQSVEIPSRFETQFLAFTVTGTGQLNAPEAKVRLGHAQGTVRYATVVPMGQAVEIAKSYGMSVGSAGFSVFLRPDTDNGAVYEIDNSLFSSIYDGDDAGAGSSLRGRFVLDAYTGELIERPSQI